MRATLTTIISVSACLFFASVSQAHHAFTAEFDVKQPIQLRGVVTKFDFQNPHTWIHMDVKDDKGNVTNWAIEGGTPNVLIRKGITKNSLPVGTEIVVNGFRAKDGAFRANGLDVTFPDGRLILLGSSGPSGNPDKPGADK
jgi:cell division FtsZ-interacting protein ZapD